MSVCPKCKNVKGNRVIDTVERRLHIPARIVYQCKCGTKWYIRDPKDERGPDENRT